MNLKLAWRNIWRNKRRTLITLASVVFAVLFASVMESFQKGSWNHMINNVVSFYYGYAQIHKQGYWDEKSLENSFRLDDSLFRKADEIEEIKGLVPRLESFALASAEENTKGSLVVGIDPEREDRMTGLRERLVAGEYLKGEERAVLLAEGLAKRLGLEVGDTAVYISQGFHGVNAAGKYPVRGIVRFGSPELNKQMSYLPLGEAQWFYGAEGRVTSIALVLEDRSDISAALRKLKERLNTEDYEIMDWQELLPELVEAKALDSAGNYIIYFILYLIIAFGLFGTILMMSKEREYEFGILISIGMRRLQLGFMVWLEVLMLGLLGAFCGILASIPIVWYFEQNPVRFQGDYAGVLEKWGFEPIFPTELDPRHFLIQAAVVFLLTSLLALYPLIKLNKMNVIDAMHD